MLTAAQRRCLAVSLRHIERELAWTERLLEWTYRGVTVSFADDLPNAVRQGLQSGIDEARGLIRGLYENVGFPAEEMAKSRWISGRLTTLWVVAEEWQSRYLPGYGEIGSDVPAVIDPPARRLGELLLQMAAEVRAGTGSHGKESV
jgi:hypothetical protein